MYTSKYEKEIVRATKEFAQINNIPFSAMTALLILNTIRQVKFDCKNAFVNKKYNKEVGGV